MSIEAIFYVYALVDPLDNRRFYIGKGVKRRAWVHLRRKDGNTAKWSRICAIRKRGAEPQVEIVQAGMEEVDAFVLERALIRDTAGLTNIKKGGEGWSRVSQSIRQRVKLVERCKQLLRTVKSPMTILAEGEWRTKGGYVSSPQSRLDCAEWVRSMLTKTINDCLAGA